jgi:hypothetical protein
VRTQVLYNIQQTVVGATQTLLPFDQLVLAQEKCNCGVDIGTNYNLGS